MKEKESNLVDMIKEYTETEDPELIKYREREDKLFEDLYFKGKNNNE